MGQESLVNEQIEAGKEFVREFNDAYPVDVAFWLNDADSEDWDLYVASSGITDENLDVAYREVLKCLSVGKNQWLDAFQVKLLKHADQLATETLEIRDRYAAKVPTRYNGSSIAGRAVEGAYIYPPLTAPSMAS